MAHLDIGPEPLAGLVTRLHVLRLLENRVWISLDCVTTDILDMVFVPQAYAILNIKPKV